MPEQQPCDDHLNEMPHSADAHSAGYPPDLCVPAHHPGAVRFLEEHARIIKLPGGSWRVWLRSAGIRVYGTTRWAALNEAAKRVEGRPFNKLLPKRVTRRASGA